MRVLVCGGREFTDVPRLWSTLDALLQQHRFKVVIDGASDDVTGPYKGADYWAHQWAIARDIPTERFSAAWKDLGKAAGPVRNRRMIDEGKPDLVVAFPGGKGTGNMVQQAMDAGIKVVLS
jgi:hypothetical protein